MILYIPVLEGHWKQKELWDGTYILEDLFDIHEAMLVMGENKNRVMEYESKRAEKEAKQKKF